MTDNNLKVVNVRLTTQQIEHLAQLRAQGFNTSMLIRSAIDTVICDKLGITP